MGYKVLQNPATPRGQESLYAELAIRDARARQARVEAERTAERQRQKQIAETREALKAETAKRKAQAEEASRQTAARRLDSDLRTAFFRANAGADESAFLRLLPGLRDDFMRKQTLESFETLKARKKISGGYSF